MSKLQKNIDGTLLFYNNKPSLIGEVHPLKEDSDVTGGQRLNETDKGSAEVEELRAVLLATQQGANHIYTDSYDVFKGATKWIGPCAVND